MSAQDIRDKDIVTLIGCDLALFNFDGPELDSGTVAEFMFAKFADIPSLLLRTDFRRGGDQGEDPWNLMMSFYPRTRTLCLNSLEIYKEALKFRDDTGARRAKPGRSGRRSGRQGVGTPEPTGARDSTRIGRTGFSLAQQNAGISFPRER